MSLDKELSYKDSSTEDVNLKKFSLQCNQENTGQNFTCTRTFKT